MQHAPEEDYVFTRIEQRCPSGCCTLGWKPVRAPLKRVREMEGLVKALDRMRGAILRGEFDPEVN